MAIQFPDLASIVLRGTANATAARQAQSNADRNISQNVFTGVDGLLEGVGDRIRRGREKTASELIDKAIEDKRRYLAGEVEDDAEKARLSKLYDIPESEQWLALAGRVAPYSQAMSAALAQRGEAAKREELELTKMGGDPQTIRLQNYVKSLEEQRSNLVKNAFDSLESLDLNDALRRLQSLGSQIDSGNAAIGKRLGLDVPAPAATADGASPAAVLDDVGQELASQKLLEMRAISSSKDARAFLDAVRNDPELPIAVKGVVARFGLQRLKELQAMDKDLQQLDQAERRLEMEKGDKLFGHLEGNAVKVQTQLDGLRGILSGWDGAPKTFTEAKARLQSLGGALQAVRVASGETQTDNSLLTLIQQAIGLADREELTADTYNTTVADVVNAIYSQAQAHNGLVARAAKDAGSDYLKNRAGALSVELGEKPAFAKQTQDFKSKSFIGSSGGGDGENPLNLTPEEKERLRKLAGA